MDKTNTKILVVDDDHSCRVCLAEFLALKGFEVRQAANTAEAKAHLRSEIFNAATVDLRLGQESGLGLVTQLRETNSNMRIAVITAYGSIATAVEAIRRGADDYFCKPVSMYTVLHWLSDSRPETAGERDVEEGATLSLDRVEWEHINRVLADTQGNISEAARRLGIHRQSLQRKLKRYPPPE